MKLTDEHVRQLASMESFSSREAGELTGDCGPDIVVRLRNRRIVSRVEKVCSEYRRVRYRITLIESERK